MSTTSAGAWASFQPSKLKAARRKVVEQHPSTGGRLRAAPESELQHLKERITYARGDREALEKLARRLSASQVRGLAVQIGPWERLRSSVATLLRVRKRASLLPHLWSTWQRYPRVEVIRDLLRELGEEYGWDEVAEGYGSAVAEWVKAEEPGVAIQQWLADQGLSYSDFLDLADLPLNLDAPIVRVVREAVMTRGTPGQLLTEGADRLTDWFFELNSERRKQFGRNYLVNVDVRRWEPGVLELIREQYGSPRAGRSAFWDQAPEEIRSAFHRWFIERNLEEALGSGTDRHDYWIARSDDLVDVELGTAGGVEYAVLYFETFGVIEFFEVGNAAYFYPLDQLKEIHSHRASHPSALKQRSWPKFGRHGDNRLIHNQRWQRKADRQVQAWKRGTR